MDTNKAVVLVFLSIFALIISVALLVALSIYIKSNYVVLAIAILCIITSSVFLIHFLYRTFINENSSYKEKYIFWLMSYLMFLVVVLTIPIGFFINVYDQKKYTENYIKLLNSVEFKEISKLGKDHNVYIQLGNTDTAWSKTRLVLPEASNASMYLNNGYCGLNYDDESSYSMKNSINKYLSEHDLRNNQFDLAKLSIMVHEFGHCIDMKRDFISFNTAQIPKQKTLIIGKIAIMPKMRSQVHDIESYLLLAKKSTLWKEVFADVYSAGYMYANHPAVAQELTKGLREYRSKNKKEDPEHDSSCYLSLVMTSAKPKSNEELIKWTDKIRENKKCDSKFY
jgi:hypothetical protein